MVDPRMAHATAVQPKIAMIAAIRLNMVVCLSTLSAAPPTYPLQLAMSSTFCYKVETHVWLCFAPLRPAALFAASREIYFVKV